MKKAVVASGGKQYLVAEGDEIVIELIGNQKSLELDPLLVIDGEKVSVGAPLVEGAKVIAQVVDPEVKADKVVAIRYKSKKRVRKVRGHRQRHAAIKITKIGLADRG